MHSSIMSESAVDAYISSFPEHVQKKLQALRNAIHEAAPGAQESMGYGIPTVSHHGTLVHFAAYRRHIGFYPTPSAITAFKSELHHYSTGKGSVQFPLETALPLELIKRMVAYRVKENDEREQAGKATE